MRNLLTTGRIQPSKRHWLGAAAIMFIAVTAANAQTTNPIFQPVPENQPQKDPNVVPAGCASCGVGGVPWMSSNPLGCYGCAGPLGCGSCGDGCGGPHCVPGRLGCCEPCHARTRFGRFICGLHEALCCPDPCYEPCWIAAANASFFVDSAKPVTQFRMYWDAGVNGNGGGDRAGFFWATPNLGGPGAGGNIFWHDIVISTEAAVDRFSVFVNTPFRFLTTPPFGSPFGDMSVGTKTLLIDSELLLFSFQFTTFIPTGIPSFGTGTGNVWLEPAILSTLKLFPETYLQASLHNRIPLIDTSNAGNVLHYHFSLNHTLAEPIVDTKIIGTMEFGAYSFLNGTVSPGATPAATTYFALGPGFRIVSCNKLDIGFGMQFAATNLHFAQQLYRTEFRWRF